MTLGEKISHLRKQKGWTQIQLAELIQMNPNHVSRWEKNRVKPRRKILERLSTLFEVPLEELTPRNEVASAMENPLLAKDPELNELILKVSQLGDEHRDALRVVLQSMLTCVRLEELVRRGAA